MLVSVWTCGQALKSFNELGMSSTLAQSRKIKGPGLGKNNISQLNACQKRLLEIPKLT